MIRDHFHVPDNYFLSHSVGCLPKTSQQALQEDLFNPWISGQNWADWMPIFDRYRTAIANIIGSQMSEICPQINISAALTKIIYSVPYSPKKNVIVLSKQDFPTIGFVFSQAERHGYRLRFIDGDPTDITHWEDAIDDSVAFVHITHALSNTSQLLPVKDICLLARQSHALSIVDIAQSIGAVALDVKAMKVDFAIGTGVKFLCCGPGACFLYARLDMIPDCQPIDVGWFSHENPFEMDITHFSYANDALRFFGGTPSPAPFIMANAALKLWEEIGLEIAQNHIQAQLTSLISSVTDDILITPREVTKRGATLVINPHNRSSLRDALTNAAILHDERKEGFRFSLHGYTSQDEINLLKTTLFENTQQD